MSTRLGITAPNRQAMEGSSNCHSVLNAHVQIDAKLLWKRKLLNDNFDDSNEGNEGNMDELFYESLFVLVTWSARRTKSSANMTSVTMTNII